MPLVDPKTVEVAKGTLVVAIGVVFAAGMLLSTAVTIGGSQASQDARLAIVSGCFSIVIVECGLLIVRRALRVDTLNR